MTRKAAFDLTKLSYMAECVHDSCKYRILLAGSSDCHLHVHQIWGRSPQRLPVMHALQMAQDAVETLPSP